MATRKLPSRARSRNSTIPTSTSLTTRARPVAARTRLEPEAPSEDVDNCQSSTPALQPSTSKSLIQNDGGDSHIHVVIRCRRRSEREIQEASPIIISSEGPKGQHITIETAATTSILGVVTLPPSGSGLGLSFGGGGGGGGDEGGIPGLGGGVEPPSHTYHSQEDSWAHNSSTSTSAHGGYQGGYQSGGYGHNSSDDWSTGRSPGSGRGGRRGRRGGRH